MTGKIIGSKGIAPIDGVKKNRRVDVPKGEEQKVSEDKVAFSSVLQEMNKVREASAASDPGRAEKVRALKEQVSSGNYRPDLEKVAESLIQFLAEQDHS